MFCLSQDTLIDTLRRTSISVVHCLLPQPNAGLSDLRASQLAPNQTVTSEDLMINVPLLRKQVRAVQLVDAIRLHRQGSPKSLYSNNNDISEIHHSLMRVIVAGFPENLTFGDFRHRFDVLVSPELRATLSKNETTQNESETMGKILESLDIERSAFRLGLSRVFFRAGSLASLERERDEKISERLTRVQSMCRGYLARKHMQQLKVRSGGHNTQCMFCVA